jgi:steroid delta-isomerase-like uncharacterized protein
MSKNQAIVVRWTDEVLNRGNLDLVDELFAEDFTWEMPFNPEALHGPAAMKETVSAFRAAFTDFAVEVDHVLGEGDEVALTYRASGTNDGEMMGQPPTGESAEWRVMHVFTLRDGKIVHDVTVLDRMGLIEQLGLTGSPAEA